MKTYLILLAALMANLTLDAQTPKTINSIQELTDSIRIVALQRNIPGLMVGIVTKDTILFSGGFGIADLKNKRKVNGKTRFRMGSITKSFVAIAIQQLVAQGKLNLNDRLQRIAPEVPFANDWEETNPVRIVNLLENTSGFDDFKLNKMYRLDGISLSSKEMMLQQKPSMICRWKPSERYTYCNVNYAILGYIIAKLTGKEYDQYLKENILMPLNMSSSSFDNYSKYPKQDTKEYIGTLRQLKAVPSVTLLPGAAGSLWSCADDMTRFLQFFLKDGQPLLNPESIARMEKPTSSLGALAGLKSGYGLANEDFGRLRGHDGTLGTCKSSYRYNRELGYGFVISSNGNGLGNLETLINDYMLTKSRHVPPAILKTQPLNKTQVSPFLGYYQIADPRFDLLAFADRLMLLKIEIENDTLQFNIFGKKHQLLQMAPLVFSLRGAAQPEIAFATNADGKKVLIINKHYTEKVTAISAFNWRIAIVLALAGALVAVLIGPVAIISYLLKRLSWMQLKIMSLPMASVLLLGWGMYAFIKVKNESYLLYQLTAPTFLSISIFLGFTLFAVCSLLNIYLIFKKLNTIHNRLMKWILSYIAFSLLFITFILISNGWIGLVTWTL